MTQNSKNPEQKPHSRSDSPKVRIAGSSKSIKSGNDRKSHKPKFPVRAKPDYYRENLSRILTKAKGQADSFHRVRKLVEKLESMQEEVLKREINEDEKRKLALQTYEDARKALIALSHDLAAEPGGSASDTQLRRTCNLPYLKWRIEKEILALHWNVTVIEIDERQTASGMRMPQFLADAFESEGLD